MMNMKVQVFRSKVIKPSIPTPSNLKNYKILDQLAALVHVGIIFFFLSNEKEDEIENEIARRCNQYLEESLSNTLTRFYSSETSSYRSAMTKGLKCHERMCLMLTYSKLNMEDQ